MQKPANESVRALKYSAYATKHRQALTGLVTPQPLKAIAGQIHWLRIGLVGRDAVIANRLKARRTTHCATLDG